MLIIIIFLQGAHLIMSERNETFLWTRGSEAVMTEMTLKDDCASLQQLDLRTLLQQTESGRF